MFSHSFSSQYQWFWWSNDMYQVIPILLWIKTLKLLSITKEIIVPIHLICVYRIWNHVICTLAAPHNESKIQISSGVINGRLSTIMRLIILPRHCCDISVQPVLSRCPAQWHPPWNPINDPANATLSPNAVNVYDADPTLGQRWWSLSIWDADGFFFFFFFGSTILQQSSKGSCSFLVSGYNLRADCQWRTLVPPLNSRADAAPASVLALM